MTTQTRVPMHTPTAIHRRRLPRGAVALLPLLAASLCLLASVGVLGAPPPFPLPWLSDGYFQPLLSNAVASLSRGIVLSPASLAGSFAFAPAPWTGRMFVNESCTGVHEEPGSCRLHMRVSLLHPDDDFTLSRRPSSPCTLAHTKNAADQPFDAHTMLLSERRLSGGCNFGQKAAAVNSIGVGGLMHFACNPAAPTNCAPDVAITYANGDANQVVVPYMAHADGSRFRQYLLGHYAWLKSEPTDGLTDYSEPLIVSFPATGRLVAEEKAALRTIVENLSSLATPAYEEWLSNSALQSWQTLISNPAADPCLQRIMGVTCEDGHITSVWVPGFGDPAFIGEVHPAWGAFSRLRMLDLAVQNFYGPIPDTFCQLESLQVLDINGQSDGRRTDVRQGITSLPDCLGRLPLVFLSVANNIISSDIPSTLNASMAPGAEGSLRALQIDGNYFTRLPADFSTRFQGLSQLWMRSNPLTSPFPSFHNFTRLQDVGAQRGLTLDHCELTGPMPSDAFDGVVGLATIDVSFNRITGPLPTLAVAVPATLTRIAFNDNAFTGGVPSNWTALTSVTHVYLHNNELSGPTNALGGMLSVATLDASNNRLVNNPDRNFGETIASICSNAIVDLNLERNQLSGKWQGGVTPSLKKLTVLNIAHNRLAALPDDLYTLTVTQWDVSYNNLTGTLPLNNQPNGIFGFNLLGNPHLRVWPLPSWLRASTDSYITPPGSDYSCPELVNPIFKAMVFSVDAQSLGFNGCVCRSGKFGRPPLCAAVPELARINPVAGFSSGEIGTDFSQMLRGVAAGTAPPDASLPDGFTDDWYGSTQRLTNGVATTFIIDVRDLFVDTQPAGPAPASRRLMQQRDSACSLVAGVWSCSRSAVPESPSAAVPVSSGHSGMVQLLDSSGQVYHESSTRISGAARYQPVRMIRIQLHISRAEFNLPSDGINVYEGDVSQAGVRVASVVGTDAFVDPPAYPPPAGSIPASLHLTQTDAYWNRYGAQLSSIVDRTLVEVVVLGNAASVQFVSRAQSGTHFFATYSYDFACLPAAQYFLDPTTNQCRSTHRQLIDGDQLLATPDSLYAIVASLIAVLGSWAANLILQVAVKARSSAAAAKSRAPQPGASKAASRGLLSRLQQLPIAQGLSSAVTIALCTVWSMQVLAFATLHLDADADQHVTGSIEPQFQASYILGALPVLLVCTSIAMVLLLYPFGSRRKLRRTLGHMSRVDGPTSTTLRSTLSVGAGDEESAHASASSGHEEGGAGKSGAKAAGGGSDGLIQSLRNIPFHVLTFQILGAGMLSVTILVCHLMLSSSLNTWGHVHYQLSVGTLVWGTLVAWLLLLVSLITLVYINHLFLSALMAGAATLVFFFAMIATSSFSFVEQLQRDSFGHTIPGSVSDVDESAPLLLSKLTLVLLVLLPSCAISFILVALQTVKLRLTWDVMAKRLAAETRAGAILARDLAVSRRSAAALQARSGLLSMELSMAQHIRTVFAHIRNSAVDPSAEKRELTLWLQGQISEFVQLRSRQQLKANQLAQLAQVDPKTRRLLVPDELMAAAEMSSMSNSAGGGGGGGIKADPTSVYRTAPLSSPVAHPAGSAAPLGAFPTSAPQPQPQLARIGESSSGGEGGDDDGDEAHPLPGGVMDETHDHADVDAVGSAPPLSLIDRLNGAVLAARVPYFLTDSVAGAYVAQAAAHNFSSENSYFLACEFFYARFCMKKPAKGAASSAQLAADRGRVARMLYASFIVAGAPFQINLAGSLSDSLSKGVQGAAACSPLEASELFAPVRHVVCQLIETNLLTNLHAWDAGLMRALQQPANGAPPPPPPMASPASASPVSPVLTPSVAASSGTTPTNPMVVKLPASPSALRSFVGPAMGALPLSPSHARSLTVPTGRSPVVEAMDGARAGSGGRLLAFPDAQADSGRGSVCGTGVTSEGTSTPVAAPRPEPDADEEPTAVTVTVHPEPTPHE